MSMLDSLLRFDMPPTFTVGDTADCRFLDKTVRVTWLDRGNITVEAGDEHAERWLVLLVEQGEARKGLVCSPVGRVSDTYCP